MISQRSGLWLFYIQEAKHMTCEATVASTFNHQNPVSQSMSRSENTVCPKFERILWRRS